jgi:LuxR family transcriptional regulator, quorum-sensing system regulator SdiA
MTLTARQRAILMEFAHGLTAADIGPKLGIAVSTVHTHLMRMRDRNGVRNTAQAVALALKAGLISL